MSAFGGKADITRMQCNVRISLRLSKNSRSRPPFAGTHNVHAQVAISPRGPEQVASSARELGLLKQELSCVLDQSF
jgi:hypothetical protein